jgi:hypothetical protein
MKNMLIAAIAGAALGAGMMAVAGPVRDWHDLESVHHHVQEAINEMDRARAANHYDMAGHGVKAEQFLHQAEHELHEAIESARAGG